MDEWMAFTDTFSLAVLDELQWPHGTEGSKALFEEQWSLLRPAILYFMKFSEGQHTEERIRQAQDWLLAYGRSAEEVLHLIQVVYSLVSL